MNRKIKETIGIFLALSPFLIIYVCNVFEHGFIMATLAWVFLLVLTGLTTLGWYMLGAFPKKDKPKKLREILVVCCDVYGSILLRTYFVMKMDESGYKSSVEKVEGSGGVVYIEGVKIRFISEDEYTYNYKKSFKGSVFEGSKFERILDNWNVKKGEEK